MSETLRGAQQVAFCDLSGVLRHYVLHVFLRFFVVERQRPKCGKIAKTLKNVLSERFGLSANVLISREIAVFSCGPLVRGMPQSVQNVVNCSV